ncbi:MAG: SDR family NAD(P)-dependent oxidoreductase, partial [Nitrososphaerota archaeon]
PPKGVLVGQQQPLAGQVALVTGSSSGIGAATARELARRGARVVLAARRADELSTQAQAIAATGGEAFAVPADITDIAQIDMLVARAIERYGQIDILVNNAGIGWQRSFVRTPREDIARMLNTNLNAVVLLTHAVLPGMLERHHGAIITVASVAGHVAVDPLYSATKYGVRGFSLSLRRQLVGSGVSVSVVSPGFIQSNMTNGNRQRLPGPEIVARAIAGLITHPRREVVTPRYYRPLIWAERALPWLGDRLLRPRRSQRAPTPQRTEGTAEPLPEPES